MTQHCMGERASPARAIRLLPGVRAHGLPAYYACRPAVHRTNTGRHCHFRWWDALSGCLPSLPFRFGMVVLHRSFAPDKVIGRTIYEVSPDAPPRWRDVHARVLAGEELGQEEDFVLRKDGRAAWVRWSMRPWRNVHGRIGGALLISELITEQVEIRHALADSEARFRATFENAAVGITHVAPDGSFLRFNKALSRLLGWPADELIT